MSHARIIGSSRHTNLVWQESTLPPFIRLHGGPRAEETVCPAVAETFTIEMFDLEEMRRRIGPKPRHYPIDRWPTQSLFFYVATRLDKRAAEWIMFLSATRTWQGRDRVNHQHRS